MLKPASFTCAWRSHNHWTPSGLLVPGDRIKLSDPSKFRAYQRDRWPHG